MQGGMWSEFMVYSEQADTADWCQICHDVYCKAGRFNGVTLWQAQKWVAAEQAVMDELIYM